MKRLCEFFPLRDWEQMSGFLREAYRPDLALRHRPIFEWQFMADRHGGNASMICAYEGDALIGIHGYLALPMFWGNVDQPIVGGWGINLYARPEFRSGLGWVLLKKLKEMYPVSIGVGASEQAERILVGKDWVFHPRVPRYLGILDLERVLQIANPGQSRQDLRPMTFDHTTSPAEIWELTDRSSQYQPRWHEYPAMAFGTIRSLDYLRWRYFRHPVFRYSAWAVGAPERPAVCVFRIEQVFGDCEVRVARVVEFFHPNDAEGESQGVELIRTVSARLKLEGCVYADFIGSSSAYGETLVKAGWIEEGDRQTLPVRLSPVERKPRYQNLTFTVAQGLPSPNLESMYVTRSDGDEDRAAAMPVNA
jgi:hypothetical protein